MRIQQLALPDRAREAVEDPVPVAQLVEFRRHDAQHELVRQEVALRDYLFGLAAYFRSAERTQFGLRH